MSENGIWGFMRVLFAVLLGGLIAAFVGAVVFTLLNPTGMDAGPSPLVAFIIGITSALVLMAGGMLLLPKAAWLAEALLVASGISALWSSLLSLAVEERAVALSVLAAAGIVTVVAGWFRLGRRGQQDVGPHAEAAGGGVPGSEGAGGRAAVGEGAGGGGAAAATR